MSAWNKITLHIFALCPLEIFLRGLFWIGGNRPENAVSLNRDVVVDFFLVDRKVDILRGCEEISSASFLLGTLNPHSGLSFLCLGEIPAKFFKMSSILNFLSY